MTIVQAIDRRVNPVVNISLTGGVAVFSEAGETLLDDDAVVVALVPPIYLAVLPEEITVVVTDDDPVVVIADDDLAVTVVDDDVNVETCL